MSMSEQIQKDYKQTSTSSILTKNSSPVFPPESPLEDDVFEELQDFDNARTIGTTLRKQLDNVPNYNEDITFRYPQKIRRPPSMTDSTRSRPTSIRHAHSTSDLLKYRQQFMGTNSSEPRCMVLPIPSQNRPRSLHTSQSYDGFNQMPTRPTSPVVNQPSFRLESEEYDNEGFVISSDDFEPYKQNKPTHHQLPSTADEKKRAFTDTLSTSLSIIYAILTVTLGISFYAIDYLEIDQEQDDILHLAEGFSLTLVCLALIYLVYLIIDISIYKRKKDSFEKLMENITAEHVELKQTNEGVAFDVTLQKALSLRKQLDHRYCFNMDRHSSNFYLKVGAIGFCSGHLIHTCLIIAYRGLVMDFSEEDTSDCTSTPSFVLEIIYPFYSIILLFFIFKYSNVIINRHRDFHRLGFMHCLSASLCFWIWTIFRETAEYIYLQKSKDEDEPRLHSSTLSAKSSNNTEPLFAGIQPARFTKICENGDLDVLYQNYSPYLYPFSVEYSILVVGILYIVWIDIGLCHQTLPDKDGHYGGDPRECTSVQLAERNGTILVDCHSANKGLFGGFIVFVFVIVSIILFFITVYNSEKVDLSETGSLIIHINSFVIMICMTVATIFAYLQIVKLDINHEAHSTLDTFLCMMCLPAFFVFGIFSLIPAVIDGYILTASDILVELIQILIQTPFIIDGMSRSSNSKELRKKKPGRELVTFLVICNVAMWLTFTFEVKSHRLHNYRKDFYSKEFWSVVEHICLPLRMFYRFHSSVCLGDIWKYAYIPSGH